MNKSKNRILYIIISAFLGLTIITLLAFLLLTRPDVQGNITNPESTFYSYVTPVEEPWSPPQEDDDRPETIWFQGQEYMLNPNFTNILFMGIDDRGEVRPEGGAVRQAGQADAIMLITLCESQEIAKVLHISRDLMTDIEMYNLAHQVYGSFHGQLALQHARGRGGHHSSVAMVTTVSRVLYDIPIHDYLALNIDSIALLNEVVGGVTITFENDYTHVDPAFIEGETITMTDRQAERFVQWRDINVLGSNEDRLDRQQTFILAFFQSLGYLRNESIETQTEAFGNLQPFMTTSLSIEDIISFSRHDFDDTQTERLPGELVHQLTDADGEYRDYVYSEFHVDELALQVLIINRFFVLYGE